MADAAEVHTPTLGDYNRIARECADLRDAMATAKAEEAEQQERTTRAIAEIRLANGDTVQTVTDEVYEDAYKVLQALKDRVWQQGYSDGLLEARNAMERLYAEGAAASWSDLVPTEEIDAEHWARAVSAEQTVYVLHSRECLESGTDLRQCRFSLALDNGIRQDEWTEDRAVIVDVAGAFDQTRLTPRECSACQGDECAELRCPKSQRPCGHHCNCVMIHDHCHWCDTWWGEDGKEFTSFESAVADTERRR